MSVGNVFHHRRRGNLRRVSGSSSASYVPANILSKKSQWNDRIVEEEEEEEVNEEVDVDDDTLINMKENPNNVNSGGENSTIKRLSILKLQQQTMLNNDGVMTGSTARKKTVNFELSWKEDSILKLGFL